MIAKSNNSFNKVDGNAIYKEFLTYNRTLDMCQLSVNGRYPKTGFIKNNRCHIALYCISGNAKITIDDKDDSIKRGDVAIIAPHSLYCIVGKDLICAMSSNPAFNIEQLELVAEKAKKKEGIFGKKQLKSKKINNKKINKN